MNKINNIIEQYKLKKEENKPINIIINSSFNYKNHEINILKECLTIWSEEKEYMTPLKFEWIYVDTDMTEKVFFISTNMKELKQLQLRNIFEENVLVGSYMNSYMNQNIFSPYTIDKKAA